MTTEEKHEEFLESIGLDMGRKDMIVLGALLKAQKKPTDYIDFETLREQLAKDEGSRKGKDPLIYRALSKLEKEGFVKIDKEGHKHGYNSTIALLERSLAKMIADNLKNLERKLKEIDDEVTLFSEMNSGRMASGMIDLSAGKMKIERPVFAQGWDKIIKLLDDKVYTNIKKGDVIRIKLEWLTQIDYFTPGRMQNIERILKEGVELRALDHDRGEKKLRPSMRKLLKRMQEIGGNVTYKVLPREDATYQFISKNREGIVLIVSESPLSANWMPRTGHVELVDDAIDNFNADFEKGIDLLEYEG